MRAYVAARVLKGGNGGVENARRHAISDVAWWATTPGPADGMCGRVAVLDVGEWQDEDPRNCSRCVRSLLTHRHEENALPALGHTGT